MTQMNEDILIFDASKIRIIELSDKEIWAYEGDVVRLRRG